MPASTTHLFDPSFAVPPGNCGTERRLLGALLTKDGSSATDLPVQPHHFADPVHVAIFERIVAREVAGYAGSTLLQDVADGAEPALELVLEEVGGTAYLHQLAVSAQDLEINLVEAAASIRDYWIRRQLIDLGESLVPLGEKVVQDAFTLASGAPAGDQAKAVLERLQQAVADAERIGALRHERALWSPRRLGRHSVCLLGVARNAVWSGHGPFCQDYHALSHRTGHLRGAGGRRGLSCTVAPGRWSRRDRGDDPWHGADAPAIQAGRHQASRHRRAP